ncbi:histidine phosphatase family protein [Streptomyces sp. NPDC051569]|uniref:histidine phosphatase family protein n=1 Tax=Streptomyces sp. NPDC051569 TaxID=3365661 RepID=UPI003791E1E9
MGELILVRHGETAWSLSGQHTSYTDLPMTENGERQARSLAPLLRERRVGLTFISPMTRARVTAELAGLGPLRVRADMHEWDYGGYEGISTEEIRRGRPDWDLWTDGTVPGPAGHPGESPAQVAERADRVLAEALEALHPAGDDVVLVAHAHFLRVLTARYLGLSPAAGSLFQLATGTLSSLGRERDRPVITAWNLMLPESVLSATSAGNKDAA